MTETQPNQDVTCGKMSVSQHPQTLFRSVTWAQREPSLICEENRVPMAKLPVPVFTANRLMLASMCQPGEGVRSEQFFELQKLPCAATGRKRPKLSKSRQHDGRKMVLNRRCLINCLYFPSFVFPFCTTTAGQVDPRMVINRELQCDDNAFLYFACKCNQGFSNAPQRLISVNLRLHVAGPAYNTCLGHDSCLDTNNCQRRT